jgi:hypothetical protein
VLIGHNALNFDGREHLKQTKKNLIYGQNCLFELNTEEFKVYKSEKERKPIVIEKAN